MEGPSRAACCEIRRSCPDAQLCSFGTFQESPVLTTSGLLMNTLAPRESERISPVRGTTDEYVPTVTRYCPSTSSNLTGFSAAAANTKEILQQTEAQRATAGVMVERIVIVDVSKVRFQVVKGRMVASVGFRPRPHLSRCHDGERCWNHLSRKTIRRLHDMVYHVFTSWGAGLLNRAKESITPLRGLLSRFPYLFLAFSLHHSRQSHSQADW